MEFLPAMPRPSSVPYLPTLSGLRFVAAFCILFGHLSGWLAPFREPGIIQYYAQNVVIVGMPLFFVMSGFIMQHVYGNSFHGRSRRAALKDFAVARFSRLYPPYLFFIAVGLAYSAPGWRPIPITATRSATR
jgi:peptidoglycan/LPS O-acetylase OafA/YrhL